MKHTTPRILSFWTNSPQITKEAVAAQLMIDEIRENFRTKGFRPANLPKKPKA